MTSITMLVVMAPSRSEDAPGLISVRAAMRFLAVARYIRRKARESSEQMPISRLLERPTVRDSQGSEQTFGS